MYIVNKFRFEVTNDIPRGAGLISFGNGKGGGGINGIELIPALNSVGINGGGGKFISGELGESI